MLFDFSLIFQLLKLFIELAKGNFNHGVVDSGVAFID
jgi:hypothetical protein